MKRQRTLAQSALLVAVLWLAVIVLLHGLLNLGGYLPARAPFSDTVGKSDHFSFAAPEGAGLESLHSVR
jgi:uncharacterized membrane protein YphA (DoxX/SURF4 family)